MLTSITHGASSYVQPAHARHCILPARLPPLYLEHEPPSLPGATLAVTATPLRCQANARRAKAAAGKKTQTDPQPAKAAKPAADGRGKVGRQGRG